MDARLHRQGRTLGRLATVGATAAALVLATSTVNAALSSGSLPPVSFTYLSTTQNGVNMAGDPIRLKIKEPIDVKSTYSIVAPSQNLLGAWHLHNGPVFVTVTVGTLTFYDGACGSWNVTAGETYIESQGQILNAKALPANNSGATVEWFTTRLYPVGSSDPVVVDPPCTP
jgi:uncharacterized membrane protein